MHGPPLLAKAFRYILIALGGSLVTSGVVNIIAAWTLIEKAEEEYLGVTRHEVVGWFALLILAGIGLMVLGWRRTKAPRPGSP
jgi:uncharacterized membrane protein